MIDLKINNNRDYETLNAEGHFNYSSKEGFTDANSMGCCCSSMMGESLPGVVCPPVYECPRETVCHRYICHEVPQE